VNPHLCESPGSDWIGQYECLRQHALGGSAPTPRCLGGLDALLQNGIAVWMLAVPTNLTTQEETVPRSVASGWLETHQMETTLVLAEMTMPQLFENQQEEWNGR